MPAVDTVLLPLCVGLTLLGVIATGVAWRRGNKGRVLQGVGLALAPVALYFSGLLRLLWNGVVAVGGWASRIVFSPAVWFGLLLLGLCLVLWLVGGLVARRFPRKPKTTSKQAVGPTSPTSAGAGVTKNTAPARVTKGQAGGSASGKPPGRHASAPVDEDMAEIEALLKSRGIE
jgi:hypothetical protein